VGAKLLYSKGDGAGGPVRPWELGPRRTTQIAVRGVGNTGLAGKRGRGTKCRPRAIATTSHLKTLAAVKVSFPFHPIV